MIYYIFKPILSFLYKLICRPVIYGKQNLKTHGKAIVIANHSSMIDPVMIALIFPRNIHFMAKSELFEKPFLSFFLKSLLAFPVNRSSADIKSMKKAIDVLNSGKVFGIFPEGKRTTTGEIDKFEKGAALFAVRANAPIVPIYISEQDRRFLHKPHIHVGEPIDVEAIVSEGGSKSVMVEKLNALMYAAVYNLKLEEDKRIANTCRK